MNKYFYILIFILLIFGWLYPFHYTPWVVAENEFFILLVPLIFFLKNLKYKKIEGNILLILPLTMILFSLLQFFLIDYYFLEDFILLVVYSLFIIFMVLFGQNYNNRESRINFLKIVVLLSLANTFVVLFQYFDFNSIFVLEHEGGVAFMGILGSLTTYQRSF
ncbi:hypothetical protein [Acinetobacter indicus]|uniref:hypothetical protein n=1 Tax=Acinetobacter indicus TaxID=756892 RepID=UPI000CEC665F|nr:hypothetical protein [Acinetobacter indicus]